MLIDIIFIIVVAFYSAAGYRRGFVRGASEIGGVIIGALVALLAIRVLFASIEPDSLTGGIMVSVGFMTILSVAVLGHWLGHVGGKAMIKARENATTRRVDGVAGSLLSAGGIFVVGWIVAFAASLGALPASGALTESKVLTAIDRVVPDGADNRLMSVSSYLVEQGFGRFITPIMEVPLPDNTPSDIEAMNSFAASSARDSVVRITGKSPCTGGGTVGTGFVVGPELVMTNAHVVAGLDRPDITIGEKSYYGKVVHFDSTLDLAVVRVKGLRAEPLDFDFTGRRGTAGIVVGYPNGGPYDARGAQVDRVVTMRAADIYGDGHYNRDVFFVDANVRGGNSGGPLLSQAGDVVGVVYAKATFGRQSGYVLSAKMAANVLAQAEGKMSALTTEPLCD